MSKLPFQTFFIPAEVYRNGIRIVLTKDTKRVAKFVCEELGAKNITEEDFENAGMFFNGGEYYSIVWLPRFPINSEEIGTAVHELFHATFAIMNWAHVDLSKDSEEPYAHLLGYLVREFFKHKP